MLLDGNFRNYIERRKGVFKERQRERKQEREKSVTVKENEIRGTIDGAGGMEEKECSKQTAGNLRNGRE